MTSSQRLVTALSAARQLGLEQVGLYAQYQLALRSGWLRRSTPAKEPTDTSETEAYELALGLVSVPNRDQMAQLVGDQAAALLAEANDLDQGRVRLFGGPPQDLDLVVPLPLNHWTSIALDESKIGVEDIKYLWEPARFTWVYTLVRAYILSGDESYVETFWQQFEAFTDINLPNMGPNWVSAQEVAIRLISFTFAYQVFCSAVSSTEERIARLCSSIADHAARIPATLVYARAQNNNHLLSEAAGLITAGIAIPAHPKAQSWMMLGRRWFNHALETQITSSGTYVQHSTSYHRMMLQLALWVSNLEDSITPANKERLAAATEWLLGVVDPVTGRVPNLGHNDGSYIQPLSSCAHADFRPVVQAAAMTFLGENPFPGGPWDELAVWLGSQKSDFELSVADEVYPEAIIVKDYAGSHLTVHDQTNSTWACFRVARFNSRPAHADQLHLDLWWREHNIAHDAGTYLYNASPPWENALIHSGMHNTVIIDGIDQMTQAGRFLWLDWAQAEVIDQKIDQGGKQINIIAQHNGYRQQGVTHRRSITCASGRNWKIEDELISSRKRYSSRNTGNQPDSTPSEASQLYRARLHWLLPDWSWEIDSDDNNQEIGLKIRSPLGWINLQIGIEPATKISEDSQEPVIQLIRAGELIHGTGSASPVSGWVSPTYGYKIPAISLAVEIESGLPINFTSEWEFPKIS
jgi:hypothetical protein